MPPFLLSIVLLSAASPQPIALNEILPTMQACMQAAATITETFTNLTMTVEAKCSMVVPSPEQSSGETPVEPTPAPGGDRGA